MFRLWTPGWGPRAWWYWMREEKIPMTIAWALPRRIALWTFIRVMSATGQSPDDITYESAYKAWQAGAGR